VEVIPRFEEQCIHGSGRTIEIQGVMINSLLSSAEMVRTAQPSAKASLSKLLFYKLPWDSTTVQSSACHWSQIFAYGLSIF
jgi:hypothetical protein